MDKKIQGVWISKEMRHRLASAYWSWANEGKSLALGVLQKHTGITLVEERFLID